MRCKLICLRGLTANHVASQHKSLKIIITKSVWHSPNLNLISIVHAKVDINYLQLLNGPQMEAWALYNAV